MYDSFALILIVNEDTIASDGTEPKSNPRM